MAPRLADLRRPDEQKDLGVAVERVVQALDRDESILVYGDYDVDGQCGTALLVDFLRRAGGRVDYFVPDRMTDGYGLSEGGIRTVAGRSPDLLITVDCGISSHDEVSLAKSLGMDVVICDHHPPDGALPAADAVLNPHREDCGFADRLPCATGVAFNLICGVRAQLPERLHLKRFMDLVALATVADVVPLVDHNRVLVAHGLEVVSGRGRPGLAALCEVSGLQGRVTGMDVAFKLAPRINASPMARSTALFRSLWAKSSAISSLLTRSHSPSEHSMIRSPGRSRTGSLLTSASTLSSLPTQRSRTWAMG